MVQPIVSVDTARRLRDAGLRWTPERGDHFIVADRNMDDELFVLSDLTIEVHDYPSGPVFGFNGTTEWALDSLEQRAALWLPTEGQLRTLLGSHLRRLERTEVEYRVTVSTEQGESASAGATAPEAYANALLDHVPDRLRRFAG